jgi:hypothetical protein
MTKSAARFSSICRVISKNRGPARSKPIRRPRWVGYQLLVPVFFRKGFDLVATDTQPTSIDAVGGQELVELLS